jgi:hypothetical protein
MHVGQESKLSSKVRCPICGQDFLIYTERTAVDTMSRRVIEHALRTHHTPRLTSASAHPGSTFHIRNWSGAQPFLASPALSEILDATL